MFSRALPEWDVFLALDVTSPELLNRCLWMVTRSFLLRNTVSAQRKTKCERHSWIKKTSLGGSIETMSQTIPYMFEPTQLLSAAKRRHRYHLAGYCVLVSHKNISAKSTFNPRIQVQHHSSLLTSLCGGRPNYVESVEDTGSCILWEA